MIRWARHGSTGVMPRALGAAVIGLVAVASRPDAHIVPHNARLAKVALGGVRATEEPVCRLAGRFGRGQVFARLSGGGILARAKLKGLVPACDGETLALSLTLRSTIDHCADGDCPPTDDRLAAGSCVVRGGRCTITTVLRSPYPPGAGNEVMLQACALRHGAADAFVCAFPSL